MSIKLHLRLEDLLIAKKVKTNAECLPSFRVSGDIATVVVKKFYLNIQL